MSKTPSTDFEDLPSVSLSSETKRRKLYVHIGMHKTGTTAIQTFLTDSRDVLAKRNVIYPTTSLQSVHHFLIALACCGNEAEFQKLVNGLDPASIKKMEQWLKNGEMDKVKFQCIGDKDLVISSEALYLYNRLSIDRFRQIFEEYDIMPILVIRNFSDWLNSYYNTYVVDSSGTKDLSDVGFTPFNIDGMVMDWSSISFDGKVRVIEYGDATRKGSSLLLSFLKLIGMSDLSKENHIDSQNVSLNADEIIVIRDLHKIGATSAQVEQFRKKYRFLFDKKNKNFLTDAEIKKYDELYSSKIQVLLTSNRVSFSSDFEYTAPIRDFGKINIVRNIVDLLLRLDTESVREFHNN